MDKEMNPHDVTAAFEHELCKYTGSPYAVAIDNGANAMFLALKYESIQGVAVGIPAHTYMSVPCAIIHAGGRIKWLPSNKYLKGAYELKGTKCIDAALRFTHNMYVPNKFMCLSFTGPYKHLNLGKGGAILTDDKSAYDWFIKARFNGRNNVSYHEDSFDLLGWNFYMPPQISVMGLHMMQKFYYEGQPIENEDKILPYPDLSLHKAYLPYVATKRCEHKNDYHQCCEIEPCNYPNCEKL